MKLAIGAMAVALALSVPPAGKPQQPQRPVIVKVDSGGFHWIDALIGAGALAGAAFAVSGVFTLYFRRGRLSPHPTRKEK
jgi:hypothetical protein